MIIKTDRGHVKALVATEPDACDVCHGEAVHWTAEIGPDALYLLTWCKECWSQADPHPFEVDRDVWLTFQTMALEIHESE